MSTQPDDYHLYAIVFRLAALRPGAVPSDHGDQARAALFELVQRGDFPLAQRLHDANDHKPFTVSLLEGGKRGGDGARHFGEGDSATWRFTLLHEPAFEALLRRYLLSRELPHVRIGALSFAITEAFASGASHHDSGHIALTALRSRWELPSETLPPSFTLDFRSPTGFSLGQDKTTGEHRWRALPETRLIFSALRKKWARLGGAEPGDEFDTWAEKSIEMEPLYVETRTTLIERRPLRGFVGQVRFHLRGDPRWWPLAHLLSDLAFWTGVGYQTTRGMGQARKGLIQ
ncbi:MAG: CRISPR-associated endoribonuclease Cas6 [Anaerolineae bacterium]|nr:CRISPR-associated endoribonuclease Cas6 [Anaerolineae bacterium]